MSDAVALAPAWRAWILEHLARGLEPRAIVTHLCDHGIDKELVESAVAVFAPAARLAHGSRIRRAVGRSIPDVAASSDWRRDFWSTHWQGNLPLVLRGYAATWPARERWTFEALRRHFGAVTIEVEIERDPARHYEGRWVEMPLAAFFDRIAHQPANECYAIARNKNVQRPELAPLFDDIVVDDALFDATRLAHASSLWIGPAGTLTPLHFDTTNILFVQVQGEKCFELASPDTLELLFHLDGFYADGDLARAPADALSTITLAPGDALFIPVGWWHRVTALDASVSFSLLAFRRPNDFSRLVGPLHPRTRT